MISTASDSLTAKPSSWLPELPCKPLLLVVDDHPGNIQTLYDIFKTDCDVRMATSGEQALQFCQSCQPDLILLDVVMPGMDGYVVCRQLKGDPLTQNIPIIFVTAQNDPLEEARGLDAGVADFIIKPFHHTVVRSRIRTQLLLKHQSDLLRSMALIDGLTGVANRRYFDATLQAEWRRCTRAAEPLSLILIDVDYFKRYNDHYGHLAGDVCLQAIASTLKSILNRSHDMVARYGGEEFVCILPNTPPEGALSKALTLEAAIRGLAIPHETSDIALVVTISAGVAVAHPDNIEDPVGLLACADAALYAAKQAGRGQVQLSQM